MKHKIYEESDFLIYSQRRKEGYGGVKKGKKGKNARNKEEESR